MIIATSSDYFYKGYQPASFVVEDF